ncbi:IclR family transcriptional regulator [Lysinibacillus sp. fls2-241-R2A-57]|uniref:IclR family transcriptional regulator n=1 Tax=Lysinibacillus sp. fls2-241-R2A-57 TaxID=3040292 RepID=UPI002554F173|nr:IclR family transcriptional regulator [Lysinibacillus sp. fls2-241-R2A-57]
MGEIKTSTVSSVEKAIDILLALQSENKKSIRELGEELNISKSALHRTLQTLESRGLVRQDGVTEKYALGYKILELSESLQKDIEIRKLAYEDMEELRDLIGDTVQLSIIDNDSILIIETIDGTNALRVFSRAGKRHPITYGNIGKVFLSQKSPKEISKYLEKAPLIQYASKSIMDAEVFLEKIKEVKRKGISTSVDDPMEGAFGIAVPICNSHGEIIAVLSISGVKRFQNEGLIKLENLAKLYAAKISEKFK